MRKFLIALTILAFFSCLLLGLYTSNLIPGLDLNQPPQSAQTASASPYQQNILVIHVDSLTSKSPQLVSIWGVINYFPEPKIIFQPLYPLGAAGDAVLQSRFSMNNARSPAASFLREMNQSTQINWDNYILLDHDAYVLLHDATAQVTVEVVSDPEEGIIQVETNFYKQICAAISTLGRDFLRDISWVEVIPNHMTTNLSLDIALVNWQKLTGAGQPRCEVFSQ